MAEPLLRIRGLKLHVPIKKGLVLERQVGAVKAVEGVDLHVRKARRSDWWGSPVAGEHARG